MIIAAAALLASLGGLRFIENGAIRLGVDLDKGGSIVYLARHGGPNMINSADLGRQIQMSFYSGPVPFAPRGKQPAEAWRGLGWNPIQTGDYFGHASRTLAFESGGHSIHLKCVPMQWPLNDEPGECTFEAWFSLDRNEMKARCRLVNHRSDQTQYPARAQELPAVYTNAPWYRLMSYTGDRPFERQALAELTNSPPRSTFPWVGFSATENWAALVNEAGDGLGIVEPGCQSMSGGFFGTPGAGDASSSPTGYIAPNQVEILDSNIAYEFSYTLVVGSLDEIRSTAYRFAPREAAPSWRFKSDRRHWYLVNARDAGWPIRGALDVTLDRDDPQLIGPPGLWRADRARHLKIRAAFKCHSPKAQVFWSRFDSQGFSSAKSLWFDTIPDGKMRSYTVDLSESPEYRGGITGLRLDPEPSGAPGDWVKVQEIGFR